MKAIKFDHISEINILIEAINHYKNCKKNQKIINMNNIDKILDVILQVQKMMFKEESNAK